jgi:ABC-2 type transport system permease protein
MMRGAWTHFAIGLRLHLRNKTALLYGYLFPIVFLVAFWVLYRHEPVPLIRHFGELLTITILGGACLGLPTTIVSERERGVWRRYRLTPLPTAGFVLTTVAARYVILATAGLLQMGLAWAVGMPAPRHPGGLILAFTFVAFAFIGLGLLLAMLADNVPAVQALGQCIFLPMLIIGGVAVPITSLPEWAQRTSSFFPGRYAVDALQATATGSGVAVSDFNMVALTVIGLAGCLAATRLFRWDAGQRFQLRHGIGGIAIALAAWVGVGLAAEAGGRRRVDQTDSGTLPAVRAEPQSAVSNPDAAPATLEPSRSAPAPSGAAPSAPGQAAKDEPGGTAAARAPEDAAAAPPGSPPLPPERTPAESKSTMPPPPGGAEPPLPALGPPTWQQVTLKHIEQDIVFDRLPPDGGIVTPIASLDEEPDQDQAAQLDTIWFELAYWYPGRDRDLVQRVRNLLYIPAVFDVFQMSIERFVPALIYEKLQTDIPKDDLVKILYWIAIHPTDGTDNAIDQLKPFGIGNGPGDGDEVRQRAAVYGVKLLGRLTGKIRDLPPAGSPKSTSGVN